MQKFELCRVDGARDGGEVEDDGRARQPGPQNAGTGPMLPGIKTFEVKFPKKCSKPAQCHMPWVPKMGDFEDVFLPAEQNEDDLAFSL